MAQLYTKKIVTENSILPKKETISFILNFSKALTILKIGSQKIEIIKN